MLLTGTTGPFLPSLHGRRSVSASTWRPPALCLWPQPLCTLKTPLGEEPPSANTEFTPASPGVPTLRERPAIQFSSDSNSELPRPHRLRAQSPSATLTADLVANGVPGHLHFGLADCKFGGSHDLPSGLIICQHDSQSPGKRFTHGCSLIRKHRPADGREPVAELCGEGGPGTSVPRRAPPPGQECPRAGSSPDPALPGAFWKVPYEDMTDCITSVTGRGTGLPSAAPPWRLGVEQKDRPSNHRLVFLVTCPALQESPRLRGPSGGQRGSRRIKKGVPITQPVPRALGGRCQGCSEGRRPNISFLLCHTCCSGPFGAFCKQTLPGVCLRQVHFTSRV